MQFSKDRSDADRIPAELAVYPLLDGLGIEFERIDHESAMTIEACREIDIALGVEMCKNLFLCNTQRTKFYLLLMPGEKQFKTKLLSRELGIARTSFADSESMMKYLGVTPGSVTVLGLMNDKEKNVTLLIDSETLRASHIGCHPCANTSSLKIKMSDILEKFLPYTGHKYIEVKLKEEENV